MSPEPVLSELSYDAGVRALGAQERAVDQLRAQTGLLLAASSLTASFLGAQTVQNANGLGVLGTLALVSLIASIGLCIYVLLPKEGFVFSLSGAGISVTLMLQLIFWSWALAATIS